MIHFIIIYKFVNNEKIFFYFESNSYSLDCLVGVS